MHLINIHTQELEEFIQPKIPPYAILSHRWGSPKEELNVKEVFKQRIDRRKEGYRKLIRACRTTADAELSEAINSMFSWYRNAKICLAYLHDVTSGHEPGETSSGSELDESFNGSEHDKSFRSSVWFTRSWTLQELLAPKDVAFFDGYWNYIGTKNSRHEAIEDMTGIPRTALEDPSSLWKRSVCEKMSWAADRHATRPEDIAYSLMGIFDVNMPLLDGEGVKAFTRLQEEIIRRTNEPTILVWGFANKTSEILASSPVDFLEFRGMGIDRDVDLTPFNLTNIGLEIEATLIRYQLGTYGMIIGQPNGRMHTTLLLSKWSRQDAYYRVGISQVAPVNLIWRRDKKITLLRGTREQGLGNNIKDDEELRDRDYGFHVLTDQSILARSISPSPGDHDRETGLEKDVQWRTSTEFPGLMCTFTEPQRPSVAKMTCRFSNSQILRLHLFFDFDSRPCLLLGMGSSVVSEDYGVWDLSDTFKYPMRFLSYDWAFWDEFKLYEITDTPMSMSHFLRCETRDITCARLPPELTPPEGEVWLSFAAPGSSENTSRAWFFGISSTLPIRTKVARPLD